MNKQIGDYFPSFLCSYGGMRLYSFGNFTYELEKEGNDIIRKVFTPTDKEYDAMCDAILAKDCSGMIAAFLACCDGGNAKG